MNAIKILAIFLLAAHVADCQDSRPGIMPSLADIPYRSGEGLSAYEQERCRLDVYLPKDSTKFTTLIWFHGGGLKNGDKNPTASNDSVNSATLAKSFCDAGFAVVVPNYRLSPKASYPAYIEDAAAAISWSMRELQQYGADANRFYVGGHSAGAYLALMAGLEPAYLRKVGVESDQLAGVISVSGQTMTHYTVREERGVGKHTITADQAAPFYYSNANTPPLLVLYADSDLPARAEENAYFVAIMKDAGNKRIQGIMLRDRTHSTIASSLRHADDPGRIKMLEFMGTSKKE